MATTARWALAWTRHALPPLIVVDLGVHQARLLLAQFRREGRALIALSNDPQERTWALELGCMEAYPSLEPGEFALKIAALMQDRKPRRVGKVSAGSLLVDLSERRIVWRGKEIAAPRQMLELAAYLARHAGEFVPARVLLLEVWGEPWADPNRVHQAFWRLRRYLNEPVASPYLICLRGGHGYGYFPSGLSVNRSRASKM